MIDSKKYFKRIAYAILFLFITVNSSVYARDVNLDNFYIKNTSSYIGKLANLKINSYGIIKSSLIDTGVIYSFWVSAGKIVYIQEFANGTNVVYEYYLSSRIKKELVRFNGNIVYSRSSLNGNYLYLKTINQTDSETFGSEIVIINLKNLAIDKIATNSFMLDFTVSHYGDSIFIEKLDGIYEYFPNTKQDSKIVSADKYSSIRKNDDTVLLFMSPNRSKMLILCGISGVYKGLIVSSGSIYSTVDNVSSSSEVYWLNENKIIFRSGQIGNFYVSVYDVSGKKSSRISSRSLNTNISLSSDNVVTFLEDGMAVFYNDYMSRKDVYPLEGEDIMISPTGNEFCSLYNKKLFISKRNILNDKSVELKRNASDIYQIYNKLRSSSSEWDNDYSKEYIVRKYNIYKILVK